MSMIPSSFEFNGLICFSQPSPEHTYYYIPLKADFARDANGRPVFSLVPYGESGHFMFTAVWCADDNALEALRREVAKRNDIIDPSTIKLAFAPVHVERCDLLMGDRPGEFQTIAANTTSGVPPYSTLFSVNLTQEQFASVTAAISGQVGHMAIEFIVSLKSPLTASGRLVPNSVRFIPWIRESIPLGRAALRSAIESAVDMGLAAIHVCLPKEAPERFVTEVYDHLLERATALLPELIREGDDQAQTNLEIEVKYAREIHRPISVRTDVSELHLDAEQKILTEAATTVSGFGEEASQSLRIALDFDPKATPLAWIRIRSGDTEAVIKRPDFLPVAIPFPAGARSLLMTVGYTNGADIYETEITQIRAEKRLLPPQQLGLTPITVDARPLAAAGAKSARIKMRCRPLLSDLEQRRTMEFSNDNWLSYWWLTTPLASTIRCIEYQWTVTTAIGDVIHHSAISPDTSNIILSFTGGATDATN